MLINLRNALMTGKRLPYDAEVEYLESTGTQWIDTGVISDGTGLTAEVTCSKTTSSTQEMSIVGRSKNDGFEIYAYNSRFSLWNSAGANPTNPTAVSANEIYNVIGSTVGGITSITVNGVISSAKRVLSFSLGNIEIFRHNNKYNWVGRIYSCKIYVNGVLVRDYIPVRKGTVGYLYDRVSGKLFGNAGAGDFVFGPDVVPVEYIESHGTEWIDLGRTIQPSDDFEFTGSIVADNANGCIFGESSFFDWGARNPAYSLVTTSSGRVYLRYGNSSADIIGLTTVGLGQTFTAALSGSDFSIDGQTVATVSRISSFQTAVSTMAVFKRNYSTGWQSTFAKARINRLKFGSTCDLIPVRVGSGSTWEGAMMDTLTRRIYRNAGTGAFTYGNDRRYPIS